jgi:hypothetical protein
MVIELISKSENLKIQNLDEFIVSGSKYQNVFKNRDEFIIDYFPLPSNKFFVITRLKRDYYIKIIDEFEDEKIIKQLDFKPEEIFLDAMGNFHLITKDSVFQVYVEQDSIHLMKPIGKYEFEKELGKLVSLRNNGAIHQIINKHNQLFSLTQLNNGEINIVYQIFHSEQYKMAVHYYNKTVAFYMRTIREADNVILMGIWDGTLMTLNTGFPKDNVEMNSDDLLIIGMIGWSDKIASKPLNVKTYGLNEEIIILDGVNDSIVKIRNEDLNTEKIKTQFTFSGDYFHDYFYDKLYMFSDEKGGIIVSKINTDDGTLKEITQIADIRQPRNIKVMNDSVYFTVLDENGFNRIVKVME